MHSKEKLFDKISAEEIGYEQLSDAEKALFLDRSEFEDFKQILGSTQKWVTPSTSSLEESWSIIEHKALKSNHNRIWWAPVAAAIAIIAMVSSLIFSSSEYSVVSSDLKEITSVTLPDGSKVTLNPLASVEYNQDWETVRELRLSGKAHFQVTEGEKFTVYTDNNYEVEVLGTAFDVSYEEQTLEVNCYSGNVRVSREGRVMVLNPGERVTSAMSGEFVKSTFNTNQAAKWMVGEFHFNNRPMGRVINELERQFGLQVVGADDDTRLYRGYFYKDDLEEALELVFKPMGYEYTLDNDIVRLK